MKVYLKMDTRNPKKPPKMIQLKWWSFNYANYKILLNIQYVCPNQTVDTVDNERIPAFKLDLEDWRELEMINANIN